MRRVLFSSTVLISRWTKVETDARPEPAGFKAKHPDVSRSRLDHIRGETTELQFLTRQLLVEIEVGAGLETHPRSAPRPDPKAVALQRATERLEVEIVLMEGDPNTGKRSRAIQSRESQIAHLRQEMEGMRIRAPAARQSATARDRKKDALSRHRRDLHKLYLAEAELRDKLHELEKLETFYEHARTSREGYFFRKLDVKDFSDLSTHVQVAITDEPWVSSRPVNGDRAQRVVLGSFGGLSLGIVLALLFDALRGKVRFLDDVVEELGLPVTTVVPQRKS